jgi:hypothetical protein
MMFCCTRALAAVGLALAVGCGSGSPRPSAEPPKDRPSAEQLRGRLDAAVGITDPVKKREVLQVLARDAADAGTGEVVLQAVKEIIDPAVKADAAEDCAVRLVRSGDAKGATAVADLIADPARRDEVKAKIARGG